MATSGEPASALYSAELVSREPKWHFLRVVRTLLGYPYERPKPFEADDLRDGEPTPRLALLIKEKATDRILVRQKLEGANVANEAMRIAEKDLEQLSVEEFRDKYLRV
jgi:hypothetical protein